MKKRAVVIAMLLGVVFAVLAADIAQAQSSGGSGLPQHKLVAPLSPKLSLKGCQVSVDGGDRITSLPRKQARGIKAAGGFRQSSSNLRIFVGIAVVVSRKDDRKNPGYGRRLGSRGNWNWVVPKLTLKLAG